MCEIGMHLGILNVELPLRREQEQPEEKPLTIEVPVAETETTVEPVTVERS